VICKIISSTDYPHPRLDETKTKKTGKLTISTSSTTTHQMIPPSQISIRTINSSNSSSSSTIEPPTINRYSKPISLKSWSSLLSPTTQQVDQQLPTINEDASYSSDKCYSSYCWCCFTTPDVCDIQLILPSFIGRSETRTTNSRDDKLYDL